MTGKSWFDDPYREYRLDDEVQGLDADIIRLILPHVPFSERKSVLSQCYSGDSRVDWAMFDVLNWAHRNGVAIEAHWFDKIEEEFPPDDAEYDFLYEWIVPYVTK